jgi:intracellular sulfur oxidation DsrE/DsrF family protein
MTAAHAPASSVKKKSTPPTTFGGDITMKTHLGPVLLVCALAIPATAVGAGGMSGMGGMSGTYNITNEGILLRPSGMGGMSGMGSMSGMAGLSQAPRYAKQKVVYHINYYGADAQTSALRNIQNHINAVGAENVDLRVVLHGDGVSLLLYPDALEGTRMKEANATDEMQAKIAGLKQQGVTFNVCANTLTGRKVATEDLYDFSGLDMVPSGVAELSHLQTTGFTYIKP